MHQHTVKNVHDLFGVLADFSEIFLALVQPGFDPGNVTLASRQPSLDFRDFLIPPICPGQLPEIFPALIER